jgi:hypothetical protein
MTNAWGGRHPMNVTTVVLTHRRPDDRPDDDGNFVFVTDGIEAAVAKAKELAGDKNVVVNGGQMARPCLEAGQLDEVGVELVPVVLGGGTPLFAELGATPAQFDGPVVVVEGTGVTHLRYRVKKSGSNRGRPGRQSRTRHGGGSGTLRSAVNVPAGHMHEQNSGRLCAPAKNATRKPAIGIRDRL